MQSSDVAQLTIVGIEDILAARGLRLRSLGRDGGARCWRVRVTPVDAPAETFEAFGEDLGDVIAEAVALAERRPVRVAGVRRWRS